MTAAPTTPGAAGPAPIDIRQHVGLIRHVLNYWGLARYNRGAIDVSDLLQAGLRGLHRAARTYDPARGKFSTYAVPSIKRFVNRELENMSCTVRVPVHAQHSRRRAGARKVFPTVISLEAPIRDDSELSLADRIPDDRAEVPGESLERADVKRVAGEILGAAELTEQERRVVHMRVHRQMTLQQIGQALSLTRERIRQIETKALRKLQLAAGVAPTGGSLADVADSGRCRRSA